MRLCLLLILSTVHVWANDPGTMPVQRTSVSQDADLLDALIRLARFDEAEWLCRTRLSEAGDNAFLRDWWTCGLSRVLAGNLMADGRLSDEELVMAQAPIHENLQSYPDSTYELFARFQLIELLREGCFQDSLAASTSGTDSEESKLAVKRGARVAIESDALIARIVDQRSRFATAKLDSNQQSLGEDLSQLEQRLRVSSAQTLLVLTDVFADGSRDQQDAATKALRSVESSMESLPPKSTGWMELQLLRVEAILRSGDVRQAMSAYQVIASAMPVELQRQSLAMRLRLALADGQWANVMRQLEMYRQSGSNSFEVDLIQLRFLIGLAGLAPEQLEDLGKTNLDLDAEIQSWIDSIAARYGTYERRRAEAMVLRSLGASAGREPHSDPKIGPGLVAAQGEDWLRRGDPFRAGEMLAAAALAEPDHQRSRVYASKAAAAFVAANDSFKAASILYQVAIRQGDDAEAAALAVQGILLLANIGDAKYNEQLEKMIRETLQRWPNEKHVVGIRDWYSGSLEQRSRWIDAAELVTPLDLNSLDEIDLLQVIAKWHKAAEQVDSSELTTLSDRFQAAFARIDAVSNGELRSGYLAAAAFTLTRDELRRIDTELAVSSNEISRVHEVPLALLKFRKTGIPPAPLQAAAKSWHSQLEKRLMNDARIDPSFRTDVATLIASWPNEHTISLSHVERLVWLGKTDQAIAAAKSLAEKSLNAGEAVRGIARLFESAGDTATRAVAIQWWDELASGLPRNSDDWHEAKMNAIELLVNIGKRDEAVKRVRYILLTHPPSDGELKRRYQQVAPGDVK